MTDINAHTVRGASHSRLRPHRALLGGASNARSPLRARLSPFACPQATSGICYRTLQYADSQVNKLEISPDKQYLAAAGNPAIRLYEVNTSNPQPVTTFEGHTGNVTAVGFERDGRWMYSGSEDGTVKIWDLRAPGFQREYESRGAVNSVVLHPNQARAPAVAMHSVLCGFSCAWVCLRFRAE